MNIQLVSADYQNEAHGRDILALMDKYALDPMGGGTPLTEYVKSSLMSELAKRPHALTVICYVDSNPAGLINGFEGFSTFNGKPLINVHDLIVLREYRGRGISQLLLTEIEAIAKTRGCCKITLEVLQGNHAAQKAYAKFGFKEYQLDPLMGSALFLQKEL